MILLIIAVAFIVLYFILVIFNISLIMQRERQHEKNLINLMYTYDLPGNIKNTFCIICQKRTTHTFEYRMAQNFNSFFELSSVGFSLMTFLSCILKNENINILQTEIDDVGILIISFMSIVFLVIALHVSPRRVANEFIVVAQLEDRIVNKMLNEVEIYSSLPIEECMKITEEYLNEIAIAEKSIRYN